MSLLPLIAALFAVPQFVPQLARLRRTADTAGVSCAWAALTSVNNGAWTAADPRRLLCWAVYGTAERDPRLMVLGWAGVATSLLILARVAGVRLSVSKNDDFLHRDRLY